SGFAAMAPIMIAALFWKRSTKWGALASTLFVAAAVTGFAVLQNTHAPGDVIWKVGSTPVLFMTPPPPRPAGAASRLGAGPGAQRGAGPRESAGGGGSAPPGGERLAAGRGAERGAGLAGAAAGARPGPGGKIPK